MFIFTKKSIKKQMGSIMPITALALVSIMSMAGLAVDSSNVFINKSRLQNLLDTAALTAAKTLDDTKNQFSASNAARGLIRMNLAQPGYSALRNLGLDANNFVIQYSSTRSPFVANPAATQYVRIRLNQNVVQIDTIFMGIAGVDSLDITGSALAGPSPELGTSCNIIPSIICGDPNQAPNHTGMYGYTYGTQVTLAMGNMNNQNVGPGNFQLLDLGVSGNSNKLRESLAGGSNACVAAGDNVATQPGANRGPVSQGFNTRFGIYSGPVSVEDFPPDMITDAGAPNYPDTYAEYRFDKMIRNYDEAITGIADRRVVTVAVGNCDGTVNGQGTINVLGFACVFLSQPAQNNGALRTVQMSGELIRSCRSAGIPGTNANTGTGAHTIQLYGDPDRWDS